MQNNPNPIPKRLSIQQQVTQPFMLPQLMDPRLHEMCSPEVRAIANLIDQLGARMFEELRQTRSGAFVSIHIAPVYDNLGALARIFVARKEILDEASLHTANGDYQLALNESIFRKEVLGPAVQRGREGSAPQQIPLRLTIDDQLLCGVMTLFIGIKKSPSATRRI